MTVSPTATGSSTATRSTPSSPIRSALSTGRRAHYGKLSQNWWCLYLMAPVKREVTSQAVKPVSLLVDPHAS